MVFLFVCFLGKIINQLLLVTFVIIIFFNLPTLSHSMVGPLSVYKDGQNFPVSKKSVNTEISKKKKVL